MTELSRLGRFLYASALAGFGTQYLVHTFMAGPVPGRIWHAALSLRPVRGDAGASMDSRTLLLVGFRGRRIFRGSTLHCHQKKLGLGHNFVGTDVLLVGICRSSAKSGCIPSRWEGVDQRARGAGHVRRSLADVERFGLGKETLGCEWESPAAHKSLPRQSICFGFPPRSSPGRSGAAGRSGSGR